LSFDYCLSLIIVFLEFGFFFLGSLLPLPYHKSNFFCLSPFSYPGKHAFSRLGPKTPEDISSIWLGAPPPSVRCGYESKERLIWIKKD